MTDKKEPEELFEAPTADPAAYGAPEVPSDLNPEDWDLYDGEVRDPEPKPEPKPNGAAADLGEWPLPIEGRAAP